jgi:hypothetical protein
MNRNFHRAIPFLRRAIVIVITKKEPKETNKIQNCFGTY